MFNIKKYLFVLTGLVVITQLTACGQSGRLYLPKASQAKQPAHVKAAKNNFDDHRLISKG